VFVSMLFVVAVFGMFEWAIRRGLPLEEVRTIVVNTLVVLAIFYLFSVRFLHAPSLTWQGILGTRPVLIGVGAVVLAQLAFTYPAHAGTVRHAGAVAPGWPDHRGNGRGPAAHPGGREMAPEPHGPLEACFGSTLTRRSARRTMTCCAAS
jgi:hypothetical protein